MEEKNKGKAKFEVKMAPSKTLTWWRSGDESSADQNLEAYFKGLKPSVCKVCGARETSTCSKCGGKFCPEHLIEHSCDRLLPSEKRALGASLG
jgi:hypothetical protein